MHQSTIPAPRMEIKTQFQWKRNNLQGHDSSDTYLWFTSMDTHGTNSSPQAANNSKQVPQNGFQPTTEIPNRRSTRPGQLRLPGTIYEDHHGETSTTMPNIAT